MNDKSSASLADKGVPGFSQRGGPLSIATSKPRPFEGVEFAQSPTSALPQPSPHRTFSGPAALPSSSTLIDIVGDASRSPVTPKSATFRTQNMRFEKGDNELKMTKTMSPTSPTSPTMGSPTRNGMARRHTVDPRMNIHTECGRHSDNWLFGGWTVSDTVKKIWDKKEPKP